MLLRRARIGRADLTLAARQPILESSSLPPASLPLRLHVAVTGARTSRGKAVSTQTETVQKALTLDDIKARISNVIDYLGSFSESDFEGAATRCITQPRWKGKTLSGEEFLLQHALPNLYFHVTTSYAILRHNGVNVGKKDFLGELPYKE